MPKVLPAIFSYEGMKEKWNEDTPDEPYSRRDELQSGRYALDKWLMRVDDEGKTLAVIGWKEHPNHTVVGGGLTTPKGRAIGNNMNVLMDARKAQISPTNMMITALVHQSGNNERWIAFGKKKGYAFPSDANFEKYSSQLPPEVKQDWLNEYPNTFGVKPVNSSQEIEEVSKGEVNGMELYVMAKSERYVIRLGSKGYDVIDTTSNTAVNRTGLSKSKANAMLEAIERGETDLTQYETKGKRKASLSRWQTILQKYLPDSSFEQHNIGEPIADLGTRDRFKDKTIQSLGNVEQQAFVTEQYLRQVSDRLPDATDSLMNKWLDKLNTLSLSKGQYWFFGTNVYEDKTYVTIDVINKGDRYLDTAKKFNLEDMDSAIVFIGVSKSMVGKIKHGERIPKGRKFIDLWGKGGVRGLQKKAGRRFPKEPVDIFKWQDILKVLPDTSNGWDILRDGDNNVIRWGDAKGGQYNSKVYYNSMRNAYIRPHYFLGIDNRLETKKYKNRRDMMNDWLNKINAAPDFSHGWFYINDDESDLSYVDVFKIKPNSKFHASGSEGEPVLMNLKPIPAIQFNSIRGRIQNTGHYIGYPSDATHLDIWGTGIKEEHPKGEHKMFRGSDNSARSRLPKAKDKLLILQGKIPNLERKISQDESRLKHQTTTKNKPGLRVDIDKDIVALEGMKEDKANLIITIDKLTEQVNNLED
tara:strand:+ start:4506 stop:6593 length:2088 start_codon:yes stop_codon:yes gene_type:complete